MQKRHQLQNHRVLVLFYTPRERKTFNVTAIGNATLVSNIGIKKLVSNFNSKQHNTEDAFVIEIQPPPHLVLVLLPADACLLYYVGNKENSSYQIR